MHEGFEQRWARARRHDQAGDHDAARFEYASILDTEPDRLYVRLRLSALEQAAGRYRAARTHALEAGATVRRLSAWKHVALVTRRLLDFDEGEAARELIVSADWADADIFRNSAVLSQYLWLTHHFDDALRLIEAAGHRAGPSHLLSYSKANALRHCGRMAEATAEYEYCLSLEPGYAYAHWSLAHHVRSDVPFARVKRIRAALAATVKSSPERAYLHYALFKELDDAGDTASAWQHLSAGARFKRAGVHYDADREERAFAALRNAPPTIGRVPIEQDATPDGTVPIFIVGLPRTGTTLLERILGGHTRVAGGGELDTFGEALSFVSDRFVPGAAMDAGDVLRLQEIDLGEVGRRYRQRTLHRASGCAFLSDKNPVNFVHAGLIARALPQARILCLMRSPMDACLSNLKELFANDAYAYSYDLDELADHYARFARLAAHWRRTLPGRFHIVDYQSLVDDTATTVAQVLAFCGLPFEEGCLDITSNTTPVSTASSSQVRQPIHGRNIGAWRRYAAPLEPLRRRLIARGVCLPADTPASTGN